MIDPIKTRTGHAVHAPDIVNVMQMENVPNWLAGIVQQSLSEIYFVDTESLHFLFASPGLRRNLGRDMASLFSLTLPDIQPELDEGRFRKLSHPLLTGEKEVVHFETAHVRSDGTRYPVEV